MIHPLRQHIEEIISLTDVEFDFVLGHFERMTKRKHQFLVQEGDSVLSHLSEFISNVKKMLN